MNIVIINHYAGSEAMGMEYRHFYLAKELIKQGHQVVIVAASFTHLRGKNPHPEEPMEVYTEDGVEFLLLKTPPYYRNNIYRVKNVAAFLMKLRHYARQIAQTYKPNVVIASSTYLLDIYPAQKIARLSGARLVFELHDVWPLSLTELYGIKDLHPSILLLKQAEKDSYQKSSSVVSILPRADLRALEIGVRGKRITYVPNGVSPIAEESQLVSEAQRRIQQLKRQDIFTVIYVGGFARANALETIIEAASLLPQGVAVVLVGKGDCKGELAALAAHKNLRNVYFEEYVAKNQVQAVLREADCLYIGARKSRLYRYGISMNKLYDYMLSARPILFGINAHNDEVSDCGCGLSVEAEDVRGLAASIEKMRALAPEQRSEMGARGRDYVLKNRNYKALAQAFIKAIQ